MQFTLKKIIDTDNGKEIVGVDFSGKEVRYPYLGTEDFDKLKELENCQIIFNNGRITGGWSKEGRIIYSAQDVQFGHDTVIDR